MRVIFWCIVLFLPLLTQAAVFSDAEVDAALRAGQESIVQTTKSHNEHLSKTGVGLFYGMLSGYSPLKRKADATAWSDLERFSYLKTVLKKDFIMQLGSMNAVDSYVQSLVGAQDIIPRTGDLQITGSLLWALRHIQEAYRAANKEERIKQIIRHVLSHSGQPQLLLMEELQKDGWEAVYWNPDTNAPQETDAKLINMHKRSVLEAQNGVYNNNSIHVNHILANYRPSSRSKTKRSLDGLQRLNRIPFWVGVANYGHHAFVGYRGNVSEAHNHEMPTSPLLIKNTPFSIWSGYTKEKYLSGIIMIPPGTW